MSKYRLALIETAPCPRDLDMWYLHVKAVNKETGEPLIASCLFGDLDIEKLPEMMGAFAKAIILKGEQKEMKEDVVSCPQCGAQIRLDNLTLPQFLRWRDEGLCVDCMGKGDENEDATER